MFAVPVTKSVTCLRGICNERLKYEIEYGLKKGTSENAYLIQDKSGGKVLIDIPFKAFQEDFSEWGSGWGWGKRGGRRKKRGRRGGGGERDEEGGRGRQRAD